MSLDRLLQVTVAKQTRTPTRQGFGTKLLAVSHSVAGSDVQTFADIGEAETAGFTAAAEPYVHRKLTVAFSQNPSPTRVKVGRRTNVSAQTVQIIPLDLTEGVSYSLGINGEAVTTLTVGATTTTAQLVTAMTQAINALTGAGADTTATDDTTHVTLAAGTASKRFYVTGLENCSITDTTTDGGIATDLTAIKALDNDFYDVDTDAHGKLEILAAAAWVEANEKIMLADSSDSACKDSGSTTDVMATIQSNAYARVGCMFSKGDYGYGRATGLSAAKVTNDFFRVGSNEKRTWAHYTIAGVPTYSLTEAEKDAIEAKNGTHYTTYAGLNLTHEGATGSGEFMDLAQFVDQLKARLQEEWVRVLATTDIRFDTQGQAIAEGSMWTVVQRGIDAKSIAEDSATSPRVFVPEPLDVPVSDRASRHYSGMVVNCRYTGAVHTGDVSVNLTV